jgi:phospholipase C
MIRQVSALSLIALLVLTGCTGYTPTAATVVPPAVLTPVTSSQVIKHVVVIFGENVSFDHYFGTYPNAANLPTDTSKFTAATGTPTNIDNYVTNPGLLTANPNLNIANNNPGQDYGPNGNGATNPFRLDHAQAATNDQDHSYQPEQLAFDDGKMDLFPYSVGASDAGEGVGTVNTTVGGLAAATDAPAIANTDGLTMGYYDGNTVTAMWNYAQHYALNDHSFGTTFGASTQGAINLISGQTNGAVASGNAGGDVIDDGTGTGINTDIGDADPTDDICSSKTGSIAMTNGGLNIGDLLNKQGVTWGWFQGGFNLGITNSNNTTACGRNTTSAITGQTEVDYIQHHEPFQYYASTQNLNHLRPTAAIGTTDQANHQYDISDFTTALAAGNLPAVSFLKAPGYEDGHAGYSDPLDEQTFVVNTINAIESSTFWPNTAIIIAYDDSDGWYDHVTDIVNGSNTTLDAKICTSGTASLPGPSSNGAVVQGRCGYGPRLPLLVISPWANKNYIDNTPTDQTSIIRFIEDTFLSGKRIGTGSYDSQAGTIDNMFNFTNNVAPNPNVVLLNATTGEVTTGN